MALAVSFSATETIQRWSTIQNVMRLMKRKIIKSIFQNQNLVFNGGIEKIAVGFTNDVYSVDDQYILKVCSAEDNQPYFKREAALYEYYRQELPVPELVVYDASKAIIDQHYMIYQKIAGENLYNVWHILTNEQKQSVIRELCDILCKINQADIADLPEAAWLESQVNWKSTVTNKLQKYLHIAELMKTLSSDEIDLVLGFIKQHQHILDEQKIGLVYWDAHFDNILVDGVHIVGLLDFERTEVASIDYALDIVRRMMDQPKKYMSEYAEQFAKNEDYSQLMDWYQLYYPELFDFSELNRRLDLYDIAHNLEDLENWPQVDSLKANILKVAANY